MKPSRRRRFQGFRYHCARRQLLAWMKVPTAAKLTWLEDANRFLNRVMTPEARRVRELFRQGKA